MTHHQITQWLAKREGRGFSSWPWTFLCGVSMFLLCLFRKLSVMDQQEILDQQVAIPDTPT